MDELVKELRKVVSKKSTGDEYLLMNSKYVPLKIDLKNYHVISNFNDSDGNNENSDVLSKKILFVDGGNTILFESAAFCVGFIRVGGIVYSNNIRIKKSLQEFYIFVNEILGKYHVKTYPETIFNEMVFNPEDELLRTGMEKCTLAKIVSVIRRFAEIDYACNANDSMAADYVVMDGTLEARYPIEKKYLDILYSKKNVCALSKTCTLTTKKGSSIITLLRNLNTDATMQNGLWYYTPVVVNNSSSHNAEMYFVKLHVKTDYVFRFEVQKEFNRDVTELLSLLVLNSSDPIFLGYPYGLIDIDQYVRVSDDESRLLKMKLSVKLGKDWNELSKHLTNTNAHSILDKIRF